MSSANDIPIPGIRIDPREHHDTILRDILAATLIRTVEDILEQIDHGRFVIAGDFNADGSAWIDTGDSESLLPFFPHPRYTILIGGDVDTAKSAGPGSDTLTAYDRIVIREMPGATNGTLRLTQVFDIDASRDSFTYPPL